MIVSIEVLYHYQCDLCEKWWSVADIKPSSHAFAFCPHCGHTNEIEGLINGNKEPVSGIAWIKLPQERPPITIEQESAITGFGICRDDFGGDPDV